MYQIQFQISLDYTAIFFLANNSNFTDVVKEMFDNWDFVQTYLIDRINITNKIALTLGQAKIDMISVFMKERGIVSLKDTICSPKKLSDMLHFNNLTAEEVSSTLCKLEDSQTQDIAITLMKNLNFDYIFRNVIIVFYYRLDSKYDEGFGNMFFFVF